MNLKDFYRPLWVFGLILVALIIFVNLVITGSVDQDPSVDSESVEPAAVNPLSSEIVQNSLSPDQATSYDIIEHDEKDRPQDPGQWDYRIKKTFQDARLEERVKQDKQYRSMVTSREDYQKRLTGVDRLIRTNEEKLAADPENAVTRQQLNELKKLRAALVETEKYFVE